MHRNARSPTDVACMATRSSANDGLGGSAVAGLLPSIQLLIGNPIKTRPSTPKGLFVSLLIKNNI